MDLQKGLRSDLRTEFPLMEKPKEMQKEKQTAFLRTDLQMAMR